MKYRHSLWRAISIFNFMDFLNFSWVYMKYCMCEFIVKSKNNLKNSRPQRDQFRVTLWTTLWGIPWDGPDRTDLGLPFKSPFGDCPRISLKDYFGVTLGGSTYPHFCSGNIHNSNKMITGKILWHIFRTSSQKPKFIFSILDL
jgi:hypothetical protein